MAAGLGVLAAGTQEASRTPNARSSFYLGLCTYEDPQPSLVISPWIVHLRGPPTLVCRSTSDCALIRTPNPRLSFYIGLCTYGDPQPSFVVLPWIVHRGALRIAALGSFPQSVKQEVARQGCLARTHILVGVLLRGRVAVLPS